MKKHILGFMRRGSAACGIGPIVLAILYLVMQHQGAIEVLTVEQVCIGIFSLTLLAFIAGGLNELYQIDRLPLLTAILIHGTVLYAAYLITYLLNDWLNRSAISVLIFSAIFIVGYFLIWIIIYSIIRKNTEKLNETLIKKQQNEENP